MDETKKKLEGIEQAMKEARASGDMAELHTLWEIRQEIHLEAVERENRRRVSRADR